MKRITALCLCLALLLSGVVCHAEDAGLVVNGSFSPGEGGWGAWSNGESGDTEASLEEGQARITNHQPIASNFNQESPMEAGKTYRLTARIRTEEVSEEGQGACISYTGYDAAGNWLCETTSPGLYGTNDWTSVEAIFTVPEDCVRTVLNVRIYFATGSAWFDDFTAEELDSTPPPSGVTEMTLSDTPNRYPVDGFGCEWDPKLLYYPSLERGASPSDLDMVAERIGILNIARVRVMVLPEWFEPRNDNDNPDVTDFGAMHFESIGKLNEMESLWAYLDVCEDRGVKVTLTWWGASTEVPNPWLASPGVTDWVSAPNNLEEMAENISALLRYAVAGRGYTCIDSVILQNEPYYSYKTAPGTVDFENYVQYYKTVRARLDRDGLSGIALIGSDDSTDFGWYQNSVDALTGTVQGFNSHSYNFRAEDFLLGQKIREFTSVRTERTDLPFFFGEFGDGSTVGAYSTLTVDDYERGLFLGIHAINTLKAGSTGSLYWPLHDVYYYAGDPHDGSNGGLMKMGLFGFATSDWKIRPTYHAWGLVCGAALSGSTVYDVTGETDWLEAVALRAPSGNWAVLADNRTPSPQTIRLDAAAIGSELSVTVFCEDAVTTEETLIQPSGTVSPEDGVYTFELPGMSFAVLSNLDDEDRAAAHVFADLGLEVDPKVLTAKPAPAGSAPESSGEAEDKSGDGSGESSVPSGSGQETAGTDSAPVWGWIAAGGAVLLAAAAAVVLLLRRKK